jgi:MerR family copper efflux transcriptional regulator
MPQAGFTIGELARRAGVSPDTVRYYERRGVLPKAERTANGYRHYSENSLSRIRFVRDALRVGFSVKQIASFVRARESGNPPCHEVRAAAGRLLEDLDRQIADMVASRRSIAAMLGDWDQRLADTPAGGAARLLENIDPRADARRRPAGHKV